LVGDFRIVIPAWSAGIQADMDVSGRIQRTLMPAIHAGMTEKVTDVGHLVASGA